MPVVMDEDRRYPSFAAIAALSPPHEAGGSGFAEQARDMHSGYPVFSGKIAGRQIPHPYRGAGKIMGSRRSRDQIMQDTAARIRPDESGDALRRMIPLPVFTKPSGKVRLRERKKVRILTGDRMAAAVVDDIQRPQMNVEIATYERLALFGCPKFPPPPVPAVYRRDEPVPAHFGEKCADGVARCDSGSVQHALQSGRRNGLRIRIQEMLKIYGDGRLA